MILDAQTVKEECVKNAVNPSGHQQKTKHYFAINVKSKRTIIYLLKKDTISHICVNRV